MKKFFPSIALRLTLWFFLLSLLPLTATALFLRPNAAAAAQFIFGLALALLISGGLTWWLIALPLREMIRSAEKMGLEDAAPLRLEKMPDELGALARAMLQTDQQLRGLVRGLENQVRELDKAYTALRQSEERVRTVFDSVNDVIIVADVSTGLILEANQKFFNLFEYARSDLNRLRVFDLGASASPFSRRNALMTLRRARKNGPQFFEWRVRSQSGREFWIDINFRLAQLDGQERALVTLRDIDQRRRAEQMQSAVYRISQAGLSPATLYEYFVLVHEILKGVLPAENFTVAFADPARQTLTFPYHLDQRQPWPSARDSSESALIEQVLRSGESLLLNAENQPTSQFADWLAAPLTTTRGVLGALILRNYDFQRPFRRSDQEAFAFLSAQIAISVERKLAEDALRQSETRWRTLMESAPQLILILDRQGIITFANHPLPGLDAPLQAGGSLAAILPPTGPQSQQNLLQTVFGARQPLTFEFSIRQTDGALRWLSCSVTPVIDRGWAELAIFNAVEITSLKQAESALRASEEMYRSIVEQLTDGFSLLDAHGVVLEWNRAMQTITGIPRAEAVGKSAWKLQAQLVDGPVSAQDERRYRQHLNKILRVAPELGVRHLYRAKIYSRDGREIHIQQILFPVHTESSARLGSLFRDITQEIQAEEQIRRLNEDLERRVLERTAALEAANRELEAFSYSISHDLRAPLRAVDGFSRLLADELGQTPPGESLRFIEVIHQNARQMGRLIDDLLAFSRLSRQPLNSEAVEMLPLIYQALEMLGYEAKNSPAQLIFAPDLLNCHGDPSLLRQVWANLLSNALKFTRDSRPPKIEIGSLRRENEIVYFVRDNGAGFDMRYSDKLFGVFQRLHHADEFEGTGVGLAIVNRIVRRHGGRVWAESQPGQGATFSFSLPEA
ncbi:MAG: hypothetical protein Fur0035_08690 [Anaerolineales bacterium]